MPKLFVFAIGGSGSRVVKALSFLLASGVKMNNTSEVIPIIIDPDTANGDLTRTDSIVKLYAELRKHSEQQQNTFFNTRISSLNEHGTVPVAGNAFKYGIDGATDRKFRDYINFGSLDTTNAAMASLLFSNANLNAKMDVGFKGNPNMGSVVLNSIKDSDYFKRFAEAFAEGDRIFIISSIFGGTGAAGFPLILKNIRNATAALPHHTFLKNAKIGAVSLLPYFDVSTDESVSINSNSFITKTKAALSYYSRTVTNSNSLDAMYYLGDAVSNPQKGSDGGKDQQNDAHFIELLAAYAIVNFMGFSDNDLATPKYMEYGLKQDSNNVSFADFGDQTYNEIAKPLAQYTLFSSFLRNHLEQFSAAPFATRGGSKHPLTKQSIDSSFFQKLTKFNSYFEEWLNEMEKSKTYFKPFERSKTGKDLLDLVENYDEKKSWNPLADNGVDAFVNELDTLEPKIDSLTTEQKLFALFSQGTSNTFKKKTNFK